VELDLNKSNQVTKNGVVHAVKSVLAVYNPKPVKVVQLFAGDPADRTITLLDGTTSSIINQFVNLNNNPEGQSVVWWLKWAANGGLSLATNSTFNGDYALKAFKPLNYWVELTTKPVFKGKYDVYLVYTRSNNQPMNYLIYFDGVQMGDMVGLQLTKDPFGNTWVPGTGKKLGTVNFTELTQHKFKVVLVNHNPLNVLDYYSLELRPAN